MNIGFDIDGVLADFNRSFIEKLISQTGVDKFPLRPFDIPTWDYPQFYGYTDGQVSNFWQSLQSQNLFWSLLQPYDDAQDVLARLYRLGQRGHNVYFITARPGWHAKLQTEQWLSIFGYPGASVLISSAKGAASTALNLDFYIDDKVENIQHVELTSSSSLLFLQNRPWNREAALLRSMRVNSPTQALDFAGL